jgi:hypothetical protein
MVQLAGIDASPFGDGPDGQVLLEPQPEQLDTPNRLGPTFLGLLSLKPNGLRHGRPGPGPLEQT